mgnify:CR=1 FL=1
MIYSKYKLVNGFFGDPGCIKHYDTEDGPYIIIPYCEDNTDYQEFLAWKAEGNEPEPAD